MLAAICRLSDMLPTDSVQTPNRSVDEKPIDFDALADRCMGRLDLVARVLARFQEAAEKEMRDLQDALERSDRDEVAKIAHRVAGSSLTASANPLAECSRRIEREASEGSYESIRQCVDEMLVMYQAVKTTVACRNT